MLEAIEREERQSNTKTKQKQKSADAKVARRRSGKRPARIDSTLNHALVNGDAAMVYQDKADYRNDEANPGSLEHPEILRRRSREVLSECHCKGEGSRGECRKPVGKLIERICRLLQMRSRNLLVSGIHMSNA
jgi:hypothetical protein